MTADTVCGPFLDDRLAQLARAALDQLVVGARAAISVRVRRRDLRETGHVKIGVRRGQMRQPADREGARRPAVVAALQRDDLVLAGLAGGEPVVAGHLHGALVGLGPADREERVVQIARGEAGELGGQLRGRAVRELASRRVVGQAHGLLGDRFGDLPPAMTNVDHGEAGEAVDELLAPLGPDVDALGALDHEVLVGKPGMILRLVGPEVPDRLAARGHGLPPCLADAITSRAPSAGRRRLPSLAVSFGRDAAASTSKDGWPFKRRAVRLTSWLLPACGHSPWRRSSS